MRSACASCAAAARATSTAAGRMRKSSPATSPRRSRPARGGRRERTLLRKTALAHAEGHELKVACLGTDERPASMNGPILYKYVDGGASFASLALPSGERIFLSM